MSRFCKIGLALGGGGARGLAHLGVLRGLERNETPIDFLTGASMGALVAGVYAQSPNSEAAIDRFQRYLESSAFKNTNPEFLFAHNHQEIPRWDGMFQRFTSLIRKGIFYSQSLTKQAPISEEKFAQNINFLLDDQKLEETIIPLAVVALDLKSGQEVVFQKDSIRRAVSASCAIPGILPPVKINTGELIDGGWIDRVPVRPARKMGADFVIAVDVAEELEEDEDFSTGLGVVLRAHEITRAALSRLQLEGADLVICPDVSKVHWSDFGHLAECVRAGEEAVAAKLDEIGWRVRKKKIRKILGYPFQGKKNPARNSR